MVASRLRRWLKFTVSLLQIAVLFLTSLPLLSRFCIPTDVKAISAVSSEPWRVNAVKAAAATNTGLAVKITAIIALWKTIHNKAILQK
jgi:hypothetical protein